MPVTLEKRINKINFLFYYLDAPPPPLQPHCVEKKEKRTFIRFHVVLIVYELVFHCLHGLYAESRKLSNVSDAIATFQ